ncbi:NRAMP family divalent metal transporter [Lignipirellula cremea]|uniref:Divalent metal cation transporter MntH n=1 Tax=Lignipirellula cremea TaxID=2528010 RepID=A0A518DUN8_9BACT|nr:divalent metal cation transporter [Lignipirellula cremea]QDU95549.1 Divalent metal cation transporter MntH [Lignipirellula cremea]
MNDPTPSSPPSIWRFLRAIGPAFIVASVVVGPGSVLSSSSVGRDNGFSMVWVVLLASAMMACMVALGARLGVVLKGTLCEELTARLGRPFTALVGLTIFLIASGYQFGNNLGVLAALSPLFADSKGEHAILSAQNLVLLLLNTAIIGFLFLFRHLYKPVELLMKVLVGAMLIAFFCNFFFLLIFGSGDPDVKAAAIVDSGAAQVSETLTPATTPAADPEEAKVGTAETKVATAETKVATAEVKSKAAVEESSQVNLLAIIALIGTTLVVPAAFYQAYLVREKGWGMEELKDGLVDSLAGVVVLASITLVIMLTAALAFHGKDDVYRLQLQVAAADAEAGDDAPGSRRFQSGSISAIPGLSLQHSQTGDIEAVLEVKQGKIAIDPDVAKKGGPADGLTVKQGKEEKEKKTLTLIGSVANINTALATLTYQSDQGADDQLTIRTDVSFQNVADVGRQLEPLFGTKAVLLFSSGIFAAAFSSFLINALIGGSMFADGLGLGGRMDGVAARVFTSIALLIGMLVAMFVPASQRVYCIVIAQAAVIIGLPLIALAMVYLSLQPDLQGDRKTPKWLVAGSIFSLLFITVSAGVAAYKFFDKYLS